MVKYFISFWLTVIGVLLSFNYSPAQFRFVKSTIRLSHEDSIKGWIDKAGLSGHPNRIRFKQKFSDEEHIFFNGAQVHSFTLENGPTYLGYSGYIDSTHFYRVVKDTVINPRELIDTLFLIPLVMGKANLYYAKDKRQLVHYFMQIGKDPPEELHYYFLQWVTTGINMGMIQKTSYHQVDNRIYKQQMLGEFSDCKEVFAKLARAPVYFNGFNLARWFRKYNRASC